MGASVRKAFGSNPTTSCDDGGGVCCTPPLPACADLGGVCQASSDLCLQGTLDGDCGDAGACCSPPLSGDDVSSDDGAPELDALSTDAEDAPNTVAIGSCNGAPCASGCACMPYVSDAGSASSDSATLPMDGSILSTDADGGMCVCPLVDASMDAEGLEDADAADAEASGESRDAEITDAAEAEDAMTPAGASDAGGSCGVIICAAGCTCSSIAASACTCP